MLSPHSESYRQDELTIYFCSHLTATSAPHHKVRSDKGQLLQKTPVKTTPVSRIFPISMVYVISVFIKSLSDFLFQLQFLHFVLC